ncbi:EbsA family protein [Vagococcus intermedius]|uniref:EbsA family protein n=1 Tax=Vagococcus intermedius TaxID=2991418 RepID=A0AAF0I6E3_9ENTE|nr:EbsA family protein [Vagococcus intermedius]WEG72630.1 EbsA family protein [Vagococcus intermedius]WEG74715.1 EbsA family protein [Vagococcus intermedius]
MKKNGMITTYRWQPEVATSLIYWSITFGIFFLSIITLLEEVRLNLLSVLILLVFIFLLWLGLQRYFFFTEEYLVAKACLVRNTRKFHLEELDKIALGACGLTITYQTIEYQFLMTAKTREALLAELVANKYFKGDIVSIKKSVG